MGAQGKEGQTLHVKITSSSHQNHRSRSAACRAGKTGVAGRETKKYTVWISTLLDVCPHGHSLISINLSYSTPHDNCLEWSCYFIHYSDSLLYFTVQPVSWHIFTHKNVFSQYLDTEKNMESMGAYSSKRDLQRENINKM